MIIKDNIARRSLEIFRKDVKDGVDYTQPWFNLDVEAYRAYKEKRTSVLPKPYCDDPVDKIMMENIQDQNILCLASGGGQQSVVFSLLGAKVTVLDLTPEQLEADQQAAKHYGYSVETIQGDMRDLSVLSKNHFDRIYQPISTLFVPELREVCSGVARVIKNGGLYFSQYAAPLLYMAENKGWDGKGYTLYVTEPYIRGAILETENKKLNFTKGDSYSEFHHLLSDIINGLIAEQFQIRGVWENPRPDVNPPLEQLKPGSEEHQARYLPFGLSVIAEYLNPKK